MFNSKKKSDVVIHIEGVDVGMGLKCSQSVKGTGALVGNAFAAGLKGWLKQAQDRFSPDLVIFNAAVIMTGIIETLGEDADEAWNMARELLEGRDATEENPKDKLIKALDELIALFEDKED